MASLKGLAYKVGLDKVVCRHCRQKTDISPVIWEFFDELLRTLASGETCTINRIGAFSTIRKVGKTIVKKTGDAVVEEGLTIKFKLSKEGMRRLQEFYKEYEEMWKEKFGL